MRSNGRDEAAMLGIQAIHVAIIRHCECRADATPIALQTRQRASPTANISSCGWCFAPRERHPRHVQKNQQHAERTTWKS